MFDPCSGFCDLLLLILIAFWNDNLKKRPESTDATTTTSKDE